MAGAILTMAGDGCSRPASRVRSAGLRPPLTPARRRRGLLSVSRAPDHSAKHGEHSERVATSLATSLATTGQIFFQNNRSMGTCDNLRGNLRGAFFSCEQATSMRRDSG